MGGGGDRIKTRGSPKRSFRSDPERISGLDCLRIYIRIILSFANDTKQTGDNNVRKTVGGRSLFLEARVYEIRLQFMDFSNKRV